MIGAAAAAPPNDNFANATVIGSLPYQPAVVSNVGATFQSGANEPQSPTSPSCLSSGGIGNTLWYRYTPAQAGSVVVETTGSTDGQGAALDTVLTVHTGSTLAGLTEVPGGCDDDANASGGTSKLQFNAAAGTTYYIRVGGWKDPNSGAVAKGNVALKVSVGAPPNDNFANATVIGSLPYQPAVVSNVGATFQSGANEPQSPTSPSCLSSGGIGNTLWYRYTPAQAGSVVVETTGSTDGQGAALDTVLTVHTGSTLAGLTEVPGGCDDDANASGGTSKLQFNAAAGTTYYIRVGGWKDPNSGAVAKGNVALKVSVGAPPNDNFANATVIGSLPYQPAVVSNTLATVQSAEPQAPTCAGTSGGIGATLWYTYTPAASGPLTVDTQGSTTASGAALDTVVVVYTGSSLAGLTMVPNGCSDDGYGTGGPSLVQFNAVGGTTYRIQVGGWKDAASGTVYKGNVKIVVK